MTKYLPLSKYLPLPLLLSMHVVMFASCFEHSGTWGPNIPLFKAKFTGPVSRPRIENLHFTLLFLLRAVLKSAPALRSLSYSTGSPADESETREVMHRLLDVLQSAACFFEEGLFWWDSGGAEGRRLAERELMVSQALSNMNFTD